MKVKTFIELPLPQFRVLFPDQAKKIPTCFDVDPHYIVRYDFSRVLIEFGYKEDKWLVQ